MNTRAKWAYLSYDSIQTKINEGVLDAYDIIYTKDSHENVIISPDLEIWSVRSRIYVFDSVEEANTQLNANTDTYIGQMLQFYVMIPIEVTLLIVLIVNSLLLLFGRIQIRLIITH